MSFRTKFKPPRWSRSGSNILARGGSGGSHNDYNASLSSNWIYWNQPTGTELGKILYVRKNVVSKHLGTKKGFIKTAGQISPREMLPGEMASGQIIPMTCYRLVKLQTNLVNFN